MFTIELNYENDLDLFKRHKQYSDTELIKLCVKNDRKAQECLYRKYFNYVVSICRKHTADNDEVLSITNNVFLKVFKNLGSVENPEALKGWIATITWRELSTYFKVQKNNYKFSIVEDAIIGHELNKAIDDLGYEVISNELDKLTQTTRNVFILHIIEGYKHNEIATKLNMTVSNSKWHLSEAKRILRLRLANLL